MDRLLELFSFL